MKQKPTGCGSNKSRSKNLGPSQSDEARRQWVGEEWRILGVFDRQASPLAVMDRRSGDAESFWTGSKRFYCSTSGQKTNAAISENPRFLSDSERTGTVSVGSMGSPFTVADTSNWPFMARRIACSYRIFNTSEP